MCLAGKQEDVVGGVPTTSAHTKDADICWSGFAVSGLGYLVGRDESSGRLKVTWMARNASPSMQ
jgi:hypothetical protein